MPTNYSMPVNLTGFSSMGVYINSVTNNVFGIGIMVVLCILIFTVLHRFYSLRLSIGGTSVLLGVFSILWRMTGLINDNIMFACIILCGVGVVYMYLSKED